MHIRKSLIACIAIAAPALLCATSVAQAKGEVFRSYCIYFGVRGPDVIGDRPDHRVTVGQSACDVTGGVLEGGVMTAQTIYEWDGPKATLLMGNGVLRKDGMLVVYKHLEGRTDVIHDDKGTHYVAKGKGIVAFASGAAASMSGKTYTFRIVTPDTGKPYFEVTMD
jgi:hypothetical protein